MLVSENTRDIYAELVIAELGAIQNKMVFAHQLLVAGEYARARKLGYGLVRQHPENSKIAIGYVGLVLEDRTHTIIPDVTAVGQDIEPGVLLILDRHPRGVVKRLGVRCQLERLEDVLARQLVREPRRPLARSNGIA